MVKYVARVQSLLATPEIIVEAANFEEAYDKVTSELKDLDVPDLPFVDEFAEWSMMDTVEADATLGSDRYKFYGYTVAEVYLDNGGAGFDDEDEAHEALASYIDAGMPEHSLPQSLVDEGYELSSWDSIFVEERDF